MEDNIMANTRKSRVPKEEQLKLINECRTSGMTDIDWCREHGDPRYIVDLVKRIVRVSVETVRIVKGLPALAESD